MRRSIAVQWGLRASLLTSAMICLTACSSSPDLTQFKLPSAGILLPSNVTTYVPSATARSSRPIGPEDLVDGQGRCAGMAAPAAGEPNVDAGNTPAASAVANRGIGLEMTECEVVRTLGQPQTTDIGSNERGERNVVLTYLGSERSGTYRFVAGRLVVLERGPEPPAPPKPAKKQPSPKKQATTPAPPA